MEKLREDLSKELKTARHLLQLGDYTTSLVVSRRLLEILFRDALKYALSESPATKRWEIVKIERDIGEGKVGIERFGLGQLLGLAVKCDLWKMISHNDATVKRKISLINWHSLRDACNLAVHGLDACPAEAHAALAASEAVMDIIGYDTTIDNGYTKVDADVRVITSIEDYLEFAIDIVKKEFYNRFDVCNTGSTMDTIVGGEYDKVLLDRISKKEIRVRRIITDDRKIKVYRILFYLAPWGFTKDSLEMRLFCTSYINNNASIDVPATNIIYSKEAPAEGTAVIALLGENRSQKMLCIKEKTIVSSILSVFDNYYNSCQLLDKIAIRKLYIKHIGRPKKMDDIAEELNSYQKYCKNKIQKKDKIRILKFWSDIFSIKE